MRIREIQKTAKLIFKGKHRELSILVILFITLSAAEKTAELTSVFFMISRGYISAEELFLPSYTPWRIIRSCFFITGNIISVLAMTAAAIWSYRIIYHHKPQCTAKTVLLMILIKFISFVSLFPSVYCIYLSRKYILKAYAAVNGEGFFVISFYLLVFAVIFLMFYLYVISGIFLSPFILMMNSGKNIFSALSASFAYIKGFRMRFFGIMISFIPYGILSLLIIPAPFALSRLITWYGIFAKDILENNSSYYDYNL